MRHRYFTMKATLEMTANNCKMDQTLIYLRRALSFYTNYKVVIKDGDFGSNSRFREIFIFHQNYIDSEKVSELYDSFRKRIKNCVSRLVEEKPSLKVDIYFELSELWEFNFEEIRK